MPKSGINSQGNHYTTPGGTNSESGESYHCKYNFLHVNIFFNDPVLMQYDSCDLTDSNKNGSWYYKNDDGSKYYNDGKGNASYTPPKERSYKSSK